ncbi:hypothetical protein HOE37_03830 [Candidatus Woesearchaeota archaeon]|jgi:hypothetical protein|nr:hypothetical protein [Candidatus Woesearchaeota archaeon]MBT4110961.1 hypothetical protein [Candidatus Woesearchaeota archaeon]MBT4336527.1 hypothetical protein [Candidatus Woesearchaeota archaeon]MBT4469724.1 hypothetical protein [Candidatus Woesearchaeota archaeon]MBT6744086.1 hypothetical protein [Candidatus Woesearchaeota archaeon]
MMIKKIILLFMVFIFSLLLVSCDSVEDDTNETDDSVDVDAVNDSNEESETEVAGDCQAGWVCLSSDKMVYRNSDCTFGDKKDCKTSCVDGVCKPAEVCDVGFKCIDESRRGYKKEDCGWIKKEDCDFGCLDGKCNPMPENYTEPVEVVEPVDDDEEAENPTLLLKVGETTQITVGDVEHNVTLYILSEEGARIIIDDHKSNFVAMGENLTYGGVKLNIIEITYQAYAGGIQEMVYTIG